MSTSINHYSLHSNYYKIGNGISSTCIDNINIFAICKDTYFVKDFYSSGNRPVYTEIIRC